MFPRQWSARIVAAAIIGFVPVGGSTGAARAGGEQRVAGSVAAPSAVDCRTHAYTDSLLTTALRIRNTFTFVFAVAPETRGGSFRLTTGSPAADLDIVFTAAAGRKRAFSTRALGGESGPVPEWATEAWVCLFAGAGAGFTYVADA